MATEVLFSEWTPRPHCLQPRRRARAPPERTGSDGQGARAPGFVRLGPELPVGPSVPVRVLLSEGTALRVSCRDGGAARPWVPTAAWATPRSKQREGQGLPPRCHCPLLTVSGEPVRVRAPGPTLHMRQQGGPGVAAPRGQAFVPRCPRPPAPAHPPREGGMGRAAQWAPAAGDACRRWAPTARDPGRDWDGAGAGAASRAPMGGEDTRKGRGNCWETKTRRERG